MNEMDVQRFFAKVDADGDCWQWTGSDEGHGYGAAWVGGRQRRAHRAAWEHLVGPIPDGLVLDHLCRNKRCVNPDHLESVTNAENVLRGYGVTAQAARMTRCPEGHELAGDNLMQGRGGRRCRICTRRVNDARKKRLLAEFLAGGTGIDHGTLSGYTLGCRCEPCKKSGSDYNRAYSARRRAGVR